MAMRVAFAICLLGVVKGIQREQPESQGCYDTVEGEPCYKAIQWAQKKGMWKNPEWYVDVKNPLDEAEMQNYFFKSNKHGCLRPCRLAAEVETKEASEEAAKDPKHK